MISVSPGSSRDQEIPAYLINMNSRPDRLAHMTTAFDRASLRFERLDAVDGKDPIIASRASELGPNRKGWAISTGAYACFQSHRKAWSSILDSGHSHGMVFEDDLHLADDLSALADPSWIPADSDVIKLETFGTRSHVSRKVETKVGRRQIVRLRSTHVGAGAYLIAARAAERLLDRTQIITDPVDDLLFNEELDWFRTAVTYQMFPAPAVQDKRRGSDAVPSAGWGEGSIAERAAAGDVIRPETSAARLARRLMGESRAIAGGTRYVVVPHG